MTLFQAKCMYDFEPEPSSGEIQIRQQETVRVTRTDVGDGWWEGYNESGRCGLFPAAYVERIDDAEVMPPPAAPLPPLPPLPSQSHHSISSSGGRAGADHGWAYADLARPGQSASESLQPESSSSAAGAGAAGALSSHQHGSIASDDWEDEWDDDSDADSVSISGRVGGSGGGASKTTASSSTELAGRVDGSGTIRRNLNRFSVFVKSGGENYILGITKVPPVDVSFNIIKTEQGYEWEPPEACSCTVTSPKKESKLKGLKSFIVYQIVPSSTNVQVSRRYKHFDWLHNRLAEKFVLVPMASLPDKQVTGRYDENFIEHRRMMLQQWVNRICRHPLLSRSQVWNHFITCVNEVEWKVGKRKAEHDGLVGANFFFSINAPEAVLLPAYIEQEIENFSKFTQSLEATVKLLQSIAADEVKRFQGPIKRRLLKISAGFRSLAGSLKLDTKQYCCELTRAVEHTAATYGELATLFEQQPRFDWQCFLHLLHEYRGMLTSLPEVLTIHKGSMDKSREYDRYGSEKRLSEEEVRRVRRRSDIVTYSLLAEMSHFQRECIADFNEAVVGFITSKITLHRRTADDLEKTLKMYPQL